MTRTKEEQAAYMREYRARRKLEEADRESVYALERGSIAPDIHAECNERIAALKAELADLKSMRPWGDIGALPLGTVRTTFRDAVPPSAAESTTDTLTGTLTTSLVGLEDQPPVPGGTTAIRDGQYAREERAPGPPKPGYLTAPDEDCVCGHDRHTYHLGGACSAWLPRHGKTKCPCPGFMADMGFE